MSGRISYLGGIVTQGLVLDLDAAKRDSYASVGTAWNDISGNANNGTLINGPTFNSGNGGSIVFDGSNNYASFSNTNSLLLNQGSVSVWTKSSTPNPNQFIYNGIIVKQNNFGIFTLNSTLVTYDWGNNTGRGTGINIVDGVWRNIVLTFTDNTGTPSNNCNFYVNGVNVLTTTIKISNNNVGLQIGNGGPAQNQYYNGSIGMSQIYNRALTATEVLQNYNATKGRYL